MKKALSLFLAFIIAFGVAAIGFNALPHTVAEAAQTYIENNFYYTVSEGNAIVTGYADKQSTDEIFIPDTLDDYPVKEIAADAFKDCNFSAITIPASVTEIHQEAFAYALNNQAFTVAEGNEKFSADSGVLVSVSDYAIIAYPQNAPSEEYTIPKQIFKIMPYAFCGTKNLKTITMPSYKAGGVTISTVCMIFDCAFLNSSVESVYIKGEEFCWMGNAAFKDSQLKEISFTFDKDNVIAIPETDFEHYFGYDVFDGTPFLEDAEYDSDGAFYYDNYLIATKDGEGRIHYDIKEGTTVIAGSALRWDSLWQVNIPASVEYISGSAFCKATSLNKIKVNYDNPNFSTDEYSAIFNIDKTTFIAYPIGLDDICYAVPKTVNKISSFAFSNVQILECVNIPISVTEIGEYAFGIDGLNSISDIRYQGTQSEWEAIYLTASNAQWGQVEDSITVSYGEYIEGKHHTYQHFFPEFRCLDSAEEKYICTCGYTYVYVFPYGSHTPASKYVCKTKETCEGEGKYTLSCVDCRKLLDTKYTPALGHDKEFFKYVEPTCEEPGGSLYKCKRCSAEILDKEEDELGHDKEFIEYIVPTCEEPGGSLYYCKRCSAEVFEEEEEKLGHNKILVSVIIPPCEKSGNLVYECTNCGTTFNVSTAKLGHQKEFVEDIEATCEEPSYSHYKCIYCNKDFYEEIGDPLGHISTTEIVAVEPTCTEDGGLYYRCERCGGANKDDCLKTYPATGHTEGEWKCTREADCRHNREETLFCTTCLEAIDVKYSGSTGDHVYDIDVIKQTCTYKKSSYYCKVCGYDFYEETFAPNTAILGENTLGIGHVVEEVVEQEPTCTQPGIKYKLCTVCGKTVGDVIETEVIGHTWETTAVIQEATCSRIGVVEVTCTVCGETDTQTLPMLAHTFGGWDYESGNTFSGKCSVCNKTFEGIEVELRLSQNEISLYNGTSETLSVTVTENISDDIIFTSSDSNVVQVDSNGRITAKAIGEAVITARIAGTEIMAQCEVTVTPRSFGLEWIVDGEIIEYSFVEEGTKIEAPVAPVKQGYVFAGWSPAVPETMPSNSLAFTAVFVKVIHSDKFDVSATFQSGCFDEDVSLNVAEIEGDREPGGVYMVEGEYYKQVGLYNIKTVNENSEVVQPNEGYKVTIRLAIPEAYKNEASFMIYHRFVDGGREQLSTANGTLKVENGYLVFDVTKFSEFEVFVKTDKPAEPETPVEKVTPSINITTPPNKTTYAYAEDIDLTGIRVVYTNSDGEKKVVTDTKHITVSGYNSKQIGTQTVTVKYADCSDTFEVKVRYTFWQWIIKIFTFGLYQF